MEILKLKRCSVCENDKSIDDFRKDRSRPDGYSYTCKVCENKSNKERYDNMSPAQWQEYLDYGREYRLTVNGQANELLLRYRRIDKRMKLECDLDRSFLKDNIINHPCTYCGDTGRIGCDRIDNSIGHTKANVIPCCSDCNSARMDNFTYEEMLILGKTIANIKKNRLIKVA